ncbi:hypothetical protein GWI33_007222 [Rhynchophorus ferrugineus]|uniref:Uncharacterized protein n=1 Tax=Rhynchophorus ferrugineus TaxID=354439 RepID=A0A834II46_RHYFE|nr:hypothetical protein GWI33_007222 [Rhynchophorus ferrugineus]
MSAVSLRVHIPADLDKSWHIPRPTLARSSQGSTSSTSSTQSGRSGSLLLTAANLAQIHQKQQQDVESQASVGAMSTRDQNIQYYLERNDQDNAFLASLPKINRKPDPDNVSIASSMHFTVVNMNARPSMAKRSCCRKHQLTILVTTMSVLFTLGILTAILLLEMRARNQRY